MNFRKRAKAAAWPATCIFLAASHASKMNLPGCSVFDGSYYLITAAFWSFVAALALIKNDEP